MSEKKPIRASLFGGFNKKDVAGYIADLSRKSGEYQTENEQLKERCYELETYRQELEGLQTDFDTMLAELDELKAEKARLEEENAALAAELASVKEDIEAYNVAKERLAALEIEASRRTVELEREARATAESILSDAGSTVVEIQASLESVRRDAARMKENILAEFGTLGSSIDDLIALSSSKQEYLQKYTFPGKN